MDSSNCLIGKTIRGYTVTELLGKGGFANVYRARPDTGGYDVAMKVINKGLIKNEELKRRVEKEAEIHSSLNHESIIKLYEFFKEYNCVFLVLELCERGTLTQYMDERGYPFCESEARDILRQVVDGIVYLHSRNIMHRDLSPRNLLLTRNGEVKIADFGLAVDTEDKHKTLCGTPNFMSPEVATRSLYGPEVDVWSLGCLLYHLLVGKPPFDATGVKRTLTNVVRDECKIPPNLSAEAKDLIELMLKKDAKRRIKLKDIKNHQFMNVSTCSSNKFVSRGGSSVESGVGSSFASSNSGRRSQSNRITTDCILELDTIQSSGQSNFCSDVNIHPRCDSAFEHQRSQNHYMSPPVKHRSWEYIQTSQNPIGLLKSKLPTLPSFGIQENGTRTRPRSQVPCHPQSRGRERDVSEERKKQEVMNAERNARYEEGHCDLFARNMEGKKTSSDCCLGGHSNSSSSCSHHQLCCSRNVQCSHMEFCYCRRRTKHCSLECLPYPEESGCCHHPQSSPEMKTSGQHSGRRSPSPKPKATKTKSLKNRTKCLNTSRLQPTRQKTRNAVISILENGEVCVEFLKKSKQIEKVLDVCLISNDGWRVIIYKPGRHGVPLKDKPPPVPKDGADDIFSFESLPEKHWKKYEYAARFVQLVRAKTSRLTYYSPKAKCVMMENIPDPDFEVSFYSGGKISKSALSSGSCSIKTSYKIVDEGGVSTTVHCDADVHELSLHAQHMWEHFQEVENQCKLIEEALMTVENSSGKSCFPVTIGRKPNSAVCSRSENNKENVNPSTIRSPLTTPISHSIASFHGTLNTEQYLSDGSSPSSEMYSYRLPSRRSNSPIMQHHQVTSLPVNQRSTSQNFPAPVFILGFGFMSQSIKGVHVQYIDHSEFFLPRDQDSDIICTSASGEVTRYSQKSTSIPKEVQDKVSHVVSIMKQIVQTSFQN